MIRIFYAVIALMGLGAVIANRRIATGSHESSAKYFGRQVRPGSAESRFMTAFSRTIAILVGLIMFISGALAAGGVIWQQ